MIYIMWYKIILIYFIVVTIFSQYMLLYRNYSFLNGYTGPGVATLEYKKEIVSNDVIHLANSCKIDLDNSKFLIVDDYTYYSLASHQYPIPISYLFFSSSQPYHSH